MRFLLGGYSADSGGSADGIGLLHAGGIDSPLASGPLGYGGTVAAAESPSWLAWHPHLDVVYATLEGRGAVQAFRRTGDDSFARLGAPVPVGDAPCHVLALAEALFVSCWGDGRVVRVALDAGGRPGEATAWAAVASDGADTSDTGDGEGGDGAGGIDLAAATRALREAAGEYAHLVPDVVAPVPLPATDAAAPRPSRAHQAVLLSGGLLATMDLGRDLVRLWRGGRLAQEIALPTGTGPRHGLWHPSGHLYVVTETSAEIFVLAPDRAGAWRVLSGIALGAMPGDAAAEIAPSHEAEHLYVGLRGSDTIAAVRVRGGGDRLEPFALAEAGAAWPRHHLVARDTLLVAGQHSDEVVSLGIDGRTGAPGRVRHRTVAPTPTAILPFRA
ncbi:lactonase family protein [Microbacterium sp. 179-B 1A2 NHS]|uniref:lactonase family protein n=1 Tax=Microbacterium sp. 179-B 1A2 NHS TaxID=3142383 RepID=UPI0039A0DDD9